MFQPWLAGRHANGRYLLLVVAMLGHAALAGETGTLSITTQTTGDAGVAQYGISVNPLYGGDVIGVNDELQIANLPPDSYRVELRQVPLQCAIGGDNPRDIAVAAGMTASTTFTVDCNAPTGSIEITTATSGEELDVDGYLLSVLRHGESQGHNIGVNDVVTVSSLAAGTYSVLLSGLATNCELDDPGTRFVDVVADAVTPLQLGVTCFVAGTTNILEVRIGTSGFHLDPDGYVLTLDTGQTRSAPVQGQGGFNCGSCLRRGVAFFNVLVGERTVTLSEMASNCSLANNPRTVTVPPPPDDFGSVSLGVVCAGPLDIDGTIVFDALLAPDFDSEIRAAGRGALSLTTITDNSFADGNPSLSPDGRRVAFESGRDGNFEIYAMDVDGGNPVRLTTHPASDRDPAWAPDGSRIAFATARDGDFEIYVMDADGANPTRITHHPGTDSAPAWSPDGNRLAFNSDRDGAFDIFVLDLAGGMPVNLTGDTGDDFSPAWSPDGGRIAFSSNRTSTAFGDIFVMNADGTGVLALTTDDDLNRDPIWSPDGSSVLYTNSFGDPGREALVLVAADGSERVDLMSPAGFNPSWVGDTVFRSGFEGGVAGR